MLTEKEVKNAKPGNKVRKLYDSNGLLLRIKPNGTKLWEYKFRVPGPDGLKERVLCLGVYDEVSLKEAREKCEAARKLKRDGKDPAEERRLRKQEARYSASSTFGAIAEEWKEANKTRWCDDHAQRTWRRVELHLLPKFSKRPISQITALDILDVLRELEKDDKTETSHRLLQICRGVFQLAVLTKRTSYNPTHDLKGALRAHRAESYPAIGQNQLPTFFEKLEEAKVSLMTRLAIKLLVLTFVRQGELRQARWNDFDLKAKEWRVRAETTKMRQLHIVPLSTQSVNVLKGLHEISGDSDYLLPAQHRTKHPIMSENTVNKAIHEMGYKGQLVGHGFRAMASTILNEKGFRADVIERQLAHMPRDKVRAAYNRAQYLPERKEMMQWWADYLEKTGLRTIPSRNVMEKN